MEINVYRKSADSQDERGRQLAIYPSGEKADSGRAAWRLIRRKTEITDSGKLNTQYDYSKMGNSLEYEVQIPRGSKSKLTRISLDGFDTETFDFGHELKQISKIVYVEQGQCQVATIGEEHMLGEGEVFVATCSEENEDTTMEICGPCTLIIGEVDFTFEAQEEPEEVAAESVSFDDYKKCLFIANTQFRWAKYLFKSLKTKWYDEALTKAIWKIERFYVTMFGLFFGLCAIVIAGAKLLTWPVTGALALAWILVFQLVIAPLCFLMVAPKPISKHIKNVDELSQYERNIYESQKDVDPRMAHLMNKYKKPALSKIKEEDYGKH